MRAPIRDSRSGLTLLEVMIASSIFALAGLSVYRVVEALGHTYESGMTRMDLDMEGARSLDRIVEALRAADRDDLTAIAVAPLFSTTVTFRRNLGFEGTEVAWSGIEALRLDPAAGEVRWLEDPDLPAERAVWRCRGVSALMDGEELDMADDNANGIADEPGFCMSSVDDLLFVGLTLEDTDADGRPVQRSWTTWIRARN